MAWKAKWQNASDASLYVSEQIVECDSIWVKLVCLGLGSLLFYPCLQFFR